MMTSSAFSIPDYLRATAQHACFYTLYPNDTPNDGVQGGETRLFHNLGDGRFVDVPPTRGTALFFRHGFDDIILHMGTRVSGDVPKYIVRLNVLNDE
mmetsp:Transcript_44202/g.134596  ORF Transcript_44202/g.134596 Transcript_44202/m.134596 type:complete len:97 (+) Transcript_44202:132-422(+)